MKVRTAEYIEALQAQREKIDELRAEYDNACISLYSLSSPTCGTLRAAPSAGDGKFVAALSKKEKAEKRLMLAEQHYECIKKAFALKLDKISDERVKDALRLRYIDECCITTMALKLGCSARWVYKLLQRGMRM